MNAQETLEQLLTLAEQLVAMPEGETDWDIILEQYSQSFDEWYRNWDSIRAELGNDAAFRQKLERLDELHKVVLVRAQSLQGQIAEDLRQLKRKGKGILAYTDVMPRSIQTMRGRKG